MARPTQPDRAAHQQASTITSEELAGCKRERDYSNLLDLNHQSHTTFIKKLKAHAESHNTWKELSDSSALRGRCIDQFLNIHGAEYWGGKNREKYIMSDSIAPDDDFRYPENRGDIHKTLVILLKKKADSMTNRAKDDSEPSQPEASSAARRANTTNTNNADLENARTQQRNNDGDDDKDAVDPREGEGTGEGNAAAVAEEEDVPTPLQARRTKRRKTTGRTSSSSDMSTLTSITSPSTVATTMTVNATTTVTTRTTSSMSMSSLSLVDAAFAQALRTKYRRDTFFMVSANDAKTAPIWVRYHAYKAASSFILKMACERGLEKKWWTPNAQMEVEGGVAAGETHADYVAAAQEVITGASVKMEWSGDEILVRWGNDRDWGMVTQLILKGWVDKEFQHKALDLFKVCVVLHVVQ